MTSDFRALKLVDFESGIKAMESGPNNFAIELPGLGPCDDVKFAFGTGTTFSIMASKADFDDAAKAIGQREEREFLVSKLLKLCREIELEAERMGAIRPLASMITGMRVLLDNIDEYKST